MTYFEDNNLPIYPVVKAFANWLSLQPFAEEFKDSIYTYPRWDLPKEARPAVCIYPVEFSSGGMGFTLEATIRIDLIRNTNTVNRAAILGFQQTFAERIIYSLILSNSFKLNYLQKYAPWVALMTSFSSDYDERTATTSIYIPITCNMQYWYRHMEETGFSPTGEEQREWYIAETYNVDDVKVKETAKDIKKMFT